MLQPDVAELFSGGHFVHLATLREDGCPQSRPAWTMAIGAPSARTLSVAERTVPPFFSPSVSL